MAKRRRPSKGWERKFNDLKDKTYKYILEFVESRLDEPWSELIPHLCWIFLPASDLDHVRE